GVMWSSSEAPMSQAGPWGRGKPRWSVVAHPAPASRAALFCGMAIVWVGPPLFCSGPSSGSPNTLPPPALKQGYVSAFESKLRLLPSEVGARPPQLPLVSALAVIVFFAVTPGVVLFAS